MVELSHKLRVWYFFRPYVYEDQRALYDRVGLDMGDVDAFIVDRGEEKYLESAGASTETPVLLFGSVKPTLERIQRRDIGRWFGADNPWITNPPDMHPCMPGVPDDEASLMLWMLGAGVHSFVSQHTPKHKHKHKH